MAAHRIDQLRVRACANGPAHHHPVKAIDGRRQIDLAGGDLELCDVGEPLLVRCRSPEVSVDDVVGRGADLAKVGRIPAPLGLGKAIASPKRLELIELLCQGERTVETLATQADISVKLASAHLKELRMAHLVDTRKEGKYVVYRLISTSVADLWVTLRTEAEERLIDLQMALASITEPGADLQGIDRSEILRRAAAGEIIVLDVRPQAEFGVAHLPYARSVPVEELKQRLAELPKDVPVVAYSRHSSRRHQPRAPR